MDQVSVSSWQSFDLLRRRRQELGLEIVSPVANRELLIRGGVIATALVGVAAVIWTGTLLYSRWQQAQEDRLKPFGAQHEQFRRQLSSLGQQTERMNKNNQALADAIVAVPSSSVLLAEMALLTPADVQLRTALQLGNTLTVTGLALQANGLRAINALQLKLEESPLFVGKTVQVQSIVEQPEGQGFSFELKADFATAARRSNRALLQSRGAMGLLRRLRLLEQEGLLP